MRRLWIAIIGCVAAACSAGNTTGTSPPATTPPGTSTASVKKVDCASLAPVTAPETDRRLYSKSTPRFYVLDVPAGYTPSTPVPVIINFHGSGSNKEQQALYSGITAKGTDAGYAVVTPDAAGRPPEWNIFNVDGQPDDHTFVTDLLADVNQTICVDQNRVFATGISAGAAVSGLTACDSSYPYAAIAMVATTAPAVNCPAKQYVSALAFHGTDDPLVPYNGGPIKAAAGRGHDAPKAEEAIATWATQDGCTAAPTTDQPWTHVKHFTYAGCANKTGVEFYAIEGGGHTWPSAPIDLGAVDKTVGPASNEAPATDLIIQFFNQHPKAA